MHDRLDKRMPTTELQVCAAILDPSMRNLAAIQEYMVINKTTGANFLLDMFRKYGEQSETGDVNITTTAATTSAVGLPDNQNSVEQQPWKKLKLNLLARHSATTDTIDREIQQYRCLATTGIEDPCTWQKKETSMFPRLAKLARRVLAIPAISAPSERVFSVAGLTVNAKRSSLAPSTVNKVIFVHENAELCLA